MSREYVDKQGRFKIEIPNYWHCQEDEASGNPVSFILDNDLGDCLQISCMAKDKGRVPDVLREQNFVENKYSDSPMTFLRRDISADTMRMFMHEAKVEDHFILATYTVDQCQANSKIIKKHILEINKSLKTLLVVHPSAWTRVATHSRFNRFMVSMLASIDLINKAQENGSAVELVILYASKIDAQLRLALILKKQLKNSTDNIDISLIFQSEGDLPIFEKDIYKRSLNECLIDESLYNKLFSLYNQRNQVVHRYIISDLKTNDIISLVTEYMDISEILGGKIQELEGDQFQKGIGIYGGKNDPTNPLDIAQMRPLLQELREKHANKRVIEEMTIKISNDSINSSK